MTTASATMVTRCPKCGTAFRITNTQLQSAKGAVRCGSCLHVFKAQDYLVKTGKPATPPASSTSASQPAPKPVRAPDNAPGKQPAPAAAIPSPATRTASPARAVTKPASAAPESKPAAKQVNQPLIRKPSPDSVDDILISDDMDERSSNAKSYEFDSFMDIELKPPTSLSLFDRSLREEKEEIKDTADESWAEQLIDEEEEHEQLVKVVPRNPGDTKPEQREEDEVAAAEAFFQEADKTPSDTRNKGLVFSLISDSHEATPAASTPPARAEDDELPISDELARYPNAGEKPAAHTLESAIDHSLFETPDEQSSEARRQVKTDPKIRAYDGSRAALLMNIMPAPIEFTAKRMRRWYQSKLWPTLSVLALITLVIQIGWLKFDYFSRVEPYRTAYLYLCPVIGCTLPTLVDTQQIRAFNLVVRAHPEIQNALLVDAIILNKAPFEQPFPDLVLAFTDINEKPVASRRFTPSEYLGGELAGRDLMPPEQPVHLTLDLVDPGPDAVNYHAYIP
ncbi:DUF3426 domain-containing protein [Cellvibrio japonicus]|uniref:MJ0042 family finger-like domain protein n=1 Tax=Cellvibrio japonicus (strain Ueda107) TaxID=498211 RepID=B3PBH6_CELJU|nr:DUF3426 domain-containing protein [Cellvibrio japonicus]ACE83922.1 MJ0042 family finger-like domain protein [Cellvibrio japonicus Ueda107]QEI13092.1 DUF3426 domain-containing protein [Cellvibrio japonicus]QEI16666.1 DUF3426 domain-containing protein [Cellvibrio japonicus]QEI20244.1 DUF3426 domain-containing protein [Cellvibrio japonicus]